jgi:hypothetical protein
MDEHNYRGRQSIKVNREIAKVLGIGPLSPKQIVFVFGPAITLFAVLFLTLKVSIFFAFTAAVWIGTVSLVTFGNQPHRFFNRLFKRPPRWRREFRPLEPLFFDDDRTNSR